MLETSEGERLTLASSERCCKRSHCAFERLRGAVVKLCDEGEFLHHEPFWNTLDQVLIDVLGQEAWQEEQAEGAAMTLDETIALARSLAAA